MPGLKQKNTQIVVQPLGPGGTITGFIVSSLQVWQWSQVFPSSPAQLGSSVALAAQNRSFALVRGNTLFVSDGGSNNFLYAVDVTNAAAGKAPSILSHVNLGA